ncbi:MFS transporter [Sodalis ligni]|uniref:MFS transporter n=1 Tax=Sodalis ligni TaxID=2697027 RepID=A0A4R1NGZ7_9GAMM|nr:MFS transporter [Sodalis ligni]
MHISIINEVSLNTNRTSRGALQKALVLLTACLIAVANPLAFTGPAVAIPAIGRALAGSSIELAWISNAFMLTFGSCLMAAGALADTFGRKKIFLFGACALCIFSVALALSPNLPVVDVLRAAQGVASALAFSGVMAALAQEFHGPSAMRAFSLVGTSFGIGLAFGPVSSGLLIEAFGWRSIFFLVAIIAGAAFVLGSSVVRDSRDPNAAGLDWKGAFTFTAALAFLTNGILVAPTVGWMETPVVVSLVGALILGAVFVFVESNARRPMLDLSLFRIPRFVAVQLLASAPAYAFVVLLVLLPVRLVGINGMTELKVGWIMMALCSPLLVLPLVASFLTRWLSSATLCGAGLLVSACGLLWLSRWEDGEAGLALVSPLLIIGMGISLPWGLMDGLALSVVPRERAGMATGIFNTTRVAGEGVALAIVNALLVALLISPLNILPDASSSASEAAQHLVGGDLAGAGAILGASSLNVLTGIYQSAFSILLEVLSAVTAITAIVIFIALRGSGRAGDLAHTSNS